MNERTNYRKLIADVKHQNSIRVVNTRPPYLLGTPKVLLKPFQHEPADTERKRRLTAEVVREIRLLRPNVVYLMSGVFGNGLHWFKPFTYRTYQEMNRLMNENK